MAAWRLRAPSPADGEAMAAVLTEAGVAGWGGFLGEDRIRAATTGAYHPADLVAADAAGLLGFVAWDEATGEIMRLYVHPRGWGSGAAKALLDAALDALRGAGCRQAWLSTEERNLRAIRFYEREGWRREGEPRVRDWHGARLCEPRFVIDL